MTHTPAILSGKTILITGAARGLGREIALGCAAAGAGLVLADIDLAGAEETTSLVTEAGGTARAEAVDLRDPAAIEALASRVGAAHCRARRAAAISIPATSSLRAQRTWSVPRHCAGPAFG